MLQMAAPKSFWHDVVLTAGFLINRMSSSALGGDIPFKCLFPDSPLFPRLRIFGCVLCSSFETDMDKLSPRAASCIFLGYSRTQKGYKCYDPVAKKRFVSTDVTLFESESFFKVSTNKLSVPLPAPVYTTIPSSKPLQVYTRRKALQTPCAPDPSPTPMYSTSDSTDFPIAL